MKDYYAILEVPPTASQAAIREQYLLLIQAWHPDKFPNPAQKAKAEEKCKQINIAYGVLSDVQKRAGYDAQLRGQPLPSREDARRRESEEYRPRKQAEEAQRREAEDQRQTEQAEQDRFRTEHERKAWEEEWIRFYFEQARKRQSGQSSAGENAAFLEPIRVLLIDDVAASRAQIRSLLSGEADISVVGEAPDGLEATRQFDTLMPDIMVAVVGIPTLESFATTEAIRRKHPTAKIIVISVLSSSGHIRRAAMAGACDYLTNPPVGGELQSAIRLAAGRSTTTFRTEE